MEERPAVSVPLLTTEHLSVWNRKRTRLQGETLFCFLFKLENSIGGSTKNFGFFYGGSSPLSLV